MTRNHLKNGHKKTVGTDFDQFCAACELIFSRPIKCCSRENRILKNAVLELKKPEMLLRKLKFTEIRIWHYIRAIACRGNHVFEKSMFPINKKNISSFDCQAK